MAELRIALPIWYSSVILICLPYQKFYQWGSEDWKQTCVLIVASVLSYTYVFFSFYSLFYCFKVQRWNQKRETELNYAQESKKAFSQKCYKLCWKCTSLLRVTDCPQKGCFLCCTHQSQGCSMQSQVLLLQLLKQCMEEGIHLCKMQQLLALCHTAKSFPSWYAHIQCKIWHVAAGEEPEVLLIWSLNFESLYLL